MALKHFKPKTPGLRQLVLVDRTGLWKGEPHKPLVEGSAKTGGRNNLGRITTRHHGGGARKKYRIVDFKRKKHDMEATVDRIEYDPNRTAYIALVTYADGEKAYILAPQRLAAGDKVVSGEKADIKPGNALPLRAIPVGTVVHNVARFRPSAGPRSAPCRTRTSRTSRSARPAARAGWASARPCAAPP
jgi:large subunit ribosomal protein L2